MVVEMFARYYFYVLDFQTSKKSHLQDFSDFLKYFSTRLIPLHELNTEEDDVPKQIRCTIEKVLIE